MSRATRRVRAMMSGECICGRPSRPGLSKCDHCAKNLAEYYRIRRDSALIRRVRPSLSPLSPSTCRHCKKDFWAATKKDGSLANFCQVCSGVSGERTDIIRCSVGEHYFAGRRWGNKRPICEDCAAAFRRDPGPWACQGCGGPGRTSGYKWCAECDKEANRYKHFNRGAKDRGLSQELSFLEWKHIIHSSCSYCDRLGPGQVDRLDGELGYTHANTIPACPLCNTVRGIMPYADFKRITSERRARLPAGGIWPEIPLMVSGRSVVRVNKRSEGGRHEGMVIARRRKRRKKERSGGLSRVTEFTPVEAQPEFEFHNRSPSKIPT